MSTAVDFLKQLRPGGPWVLTAIIPDGSTVTITANTAAEVDDFVRKHNGKRNLYYSVNPTKGHMTSKAKKEDIAAVEYLHADLDPNDNETPAEAKGRYLTGVEMFEPQPTAIIDSGNGVQCLWKLAEPVELSSEQIIIDIEARILGLTLRLGGKPGTQNIDRILRLPGTTNIPNKKKLKAGRVKCPAKMINCFNGRSAPLDAFPLGAPEQKPTKPYSGGQHARQRPSVDVDDLPVSDRIKDLIRGIGMDLYPSRSEAVMAVLVVMATEGCTDDQMTTIMLDKRFPIGEHVREKSRIKQYLTRQIRRAREKAGVTSGRQPEITVRMEDVLKSAADLQSKTFDPLRWVIPKYLPEGLSVLGGRPKVGKSWFGLDAGVAVSSGGICMGEQCEQGDVLALMLEDTDRRLRRRLTQMLGAQKERWPERLIYATGWPHLNDGGLDWMREWISKARKPRLIIVDILERVRQRLAGNDKRSQYSADYDALSTLQELSADAQLSILVLHHQRKLGAEDLIDTLSGTLGLAGAVDTVLILGKDTQYDKFLYGRGRDLEDFNVSVKQNEQGRWDVLGPRPEEQASPERKKIIAVLARTGKPMHVKQISEAVGGRQVNVKKLLATLHAEGEIERVSTGMYKLPDQQHEIPY